MYWKQEIPWDNVFSGSGGKIFVNGMMKGTELENIVVYEMSEKNLVIITAQYGEAYETDGGWRTDHSSLSGKWWNISGFLLIQWIWGCQWDKGFYETEDLKDDRKELKYELFQRSAITVITSPDRISFKIILTGDSLILFWLEHLSLSKDSKAMGYILRLWLYLLGYVLSSVFYHMQKKCNDLAPPGSQYVFGIIGVVLLIWREAWQDRISGFPGSSSVFFCLSYYQPVQCRQII